MINGWCLLPTRSVVIQIYLVLILMHAITFFLFFRLDCRNFKESSPHVLGEFDQNLIRFFCFYVHFILIDIVSIIIMHFLYNVKDLSAIFL